MDPLDVRRTRPAHSNAKAPLRESASQTAGPYVHIGCLPAMAGLAGVFAEDLTRHPRQPDGAAIRIVGHLYEAQGVLAKDAMIESWQADGQGSYAEGVWRRSWTDRETGEFAIDTVMPGADGSGLAPFVLLWVAARGLGMGLTTRLYFPEHSAHHAADPHLALVEPARRDTLLAAREGDAYRFDIHLQGPAETVFFDV